MDWLPTTINSVSPTTPAAARMMCSSCCRFMDSPPLPLGQDACEWGAQSQPDRFLGVGHDQGANFLPRLFEQCSPFGPCWEIFPLKPLTPSVEIALRNLQQRRVVVDFLRDQPMGSQPNRIQPRFWTSPTSMRPYGRGPGIVAVFQESLGVRRQWDLSVHDGAHFTRPGWRSPVGLSCVSCEPPETADIEVWRAGVFSRSRLSARIGSPATV